LALPAESKCLHAKLRDLANVYQKALSARLPPILGQALIVAEDRRFLAHKGVDACALLRAARQSLVRGHLQGGSTIEQQLVRTVTTRYERTLSRKARELMLAATVHEALDKSEILGVYLMVAHYGWSMQGVVQACRVLGQDLLIMSTHDAAALVARLKYPQPRFWSTRWEVRLRRRARYIADALVGKEEGREAPPIGELNGAIPLQR
jgi:penicillin-binding protein 1A